MKTAVLAGLLMAAAVGAATTSSNELIAPALVDRAGWTWDWQVKLPIRADEAIDRMFVFDEYVYVLTDSAMLFCVDRAAGGVRFVMPLTARELPVCSPDYVEKKLWFLVGNEAVIVDPWAGVISERQCFEYIGNTFECGLAINTSYVYVTGSDRRLHTFSRDGYWRVFTATADNDAPIISLAAVNGKVIFATMSGSVVAMDEKSPTKLWQFDTTGAIRSELKIDSDAVYIGSEDAKLYKLDVETGRLVWPNPFKAGAMLREAVTVGNQVVYLPAGSEGVYGIDRQSGKAVWQVKEGIAILTETDTHAFVFSRPGVLDVMDNKTGQKAYSVNAGQVQRVAVMIAEPKLYLADKAGRVASVTVR